MTPKACFDAANWQNAVAQNFYSQGVWFREHSKQYFVWAAEWNAKASFAFHAGQASDAQWFKALADDFSKKAIANAKAADERFAQAAFTRAAAEGSFRRGLTLQWAVGPSYPEGILTAASVNRPGRWSCTGNPKSIKNERKIETGFLPRKTLFVYRIETHWAYCNGNITKMWPADAYGSPSIEAGENGWRLDRKEKIRANCYGGSPERCAWTYQFHWVKQNPGDIYVDEHRNTCTTTQVKGNGAHYRHGSCALRSWTSDSWGGGE